MTDKIAEVFVLRTGYDPEGDEAPVRRERRQLGPCFHPEVDIRVNPEGNAERLSCRRCDADVEPLVWISRLARNWDEFRFRIEQAETRARRAEEAAARRIKENERRGRMRQMPVGARMKRVGSSIGRAQVSLGEAFVALAGVFDLGQGPDPDWYLREAEAHIARARSGLEKLRAEAAKLHASEPQGAP